jgi:hypothetical protein
VTLAPPLERIGLDLDLAVRRRIRRRQRRRRTVRIAGLTVTLAAIFCAVGLASGIGPDLQLDPTKWTIVHRGEVDDGAGAYVHAREKGTGRDSLFMVEHDAGLDRYRAFLLHERVVDAGNAAEAESGVATRTEAGPLCSPEQLTRAEVVALAALRKSFASGTPANATKQAVDGVVVAAFAGAPCRGLEYASEQARLVYAGAQPASLLMVGAR